MNTTCLVRWGASLALGLAVGCGARGGLVEPVASDSRDDDTCDIEWIDAPPLARDRERLAEPVLTGDHDGFLFVTRTRAPDRCGDAGPCVLVERLSSSGGESTVTSPDLAPLERVRLYGGTAPGGAGHYAVAAIAPASELAWGSAPDWNAPRRITLDPERGLGAVGFDDSHVWVLTHAWMSEGTVGEGHEYPIYPEVRRTSVSGEVVEGPDLDSTEGDLFVEATFAISEDHAWLVTNGFLSGPLRAAGDSWTGLLREARSFGRHAVAAMRDGALVLADDFDGEVRVARLDTAGALLEVATLPESPMTAGLAIATDGERVLVVHQALDGAAHATVLDASLAVLATSIVPTTLPLGDYTRLGAAVASDGTFALFVAPFPTLDFELNEPVELLRFRTCP